MQWRRHPLNSNFVIDKLLYFCTFINKHFFDNKQITYHNYYVIFFIYWILGIENMDLRHYVPQRVFHQMYLTTDPGIQSLSLYRKLFPTDMMLWYRSDGFGHLWALDLDPWLWMGRFGPNFDLSTVIIVIVVFFSIFVVNTFNFKFKMVYTGRTVKAKPFSAKLF